MNLPYPHFQVNSKVYPGASGEDTLTFVWLLETIEVETDACSVPTPQLPNIRLIAKHTDPAITASVMDAVGPDYGIGKILPETVADVGADGTVIDHAENCNTLSGLVWKTKRCHDLDPDSVICVGSIEVGYAVTEFDPNLMMYEIPEDTSPGRTIMQTHPDRVHDFMSMVKRENPRTRVLIGDGISIAEDICSAFEQGGHAAGAASAVSLASEPELLLRDIAMSFP